VKNSDVRRGELHRVDYFVRRMAAASAAFCLVIIVACTTTQRHPRLGFVRVSADGKGFVLPPSGAAFVPWGFNYDHDEAGRLLEDYWETEWPKVEEDFREMKQLGANVVRIHLQFGRFMSDERHANAKSLARFEKLVRVAERAGLYLDVTGLGCYHKRDVPPWYDELGEERRWSAQANFWRAIARVGRGSPAIFCYDLMNEPVAPHKDGKGTDWLGPPFGGKHFVQWISREGKGRDRPKVARAWIRQLASALRAEDPDHLITVGLVDWSLPRPGLDSAFHPETIAPELDFLSVHIYPETGKVDAAIETLKAFDVGKPVVIEETFFLRCAPEEFEGFFQRSKAQAAGWIGFYWGKTLDECRGSKEFVDLLMVRWLDWFQQAKP
jgi:hypothetical protein